MLRSFTMLAKLYFSLYIISNSLEAIFVWMNVGSQMTCLTIPLFGCDDDCLHVLIRVKKSTVSWKCGNDIDFTWCRFPSERKWPTEPEPMIIFRKIFVQTVIFIKIKFLWFSSHSTIKIHITYCMVVFLFQLFLLFPLLCQVWVLLRPQNLSTYRALSTI